MRNVLTVIFLIAVFVMCIFCRVGSVDPSALIIGLLAVWFVWQDSRRNNTPVLQIIKCEGMSCSSVFENNARFFHRLSVSLRNHGISLWNIKVTLQFNLEGGGSSSFEMTQSVSQSANNVSVAEQTVAERPLGPVEFARGMVAEYTLKSYTFVVDNSPPNFAITRLKDPIKQKAKICVFSQDYLVYEFKVGSSWDRAKKWWNRLAYKFNSKFDKTIDRPGDVPMLEPIPKLGLIPGDIRTDEME